MKLAPASIRNYATQDVCRHQLQLRTNARAKLAPGTRACTKNRHVAARCRQLQLREKGRQWQRCAQGRQRPCEKGRQWLLREKHLHRLCGQGRQRLRAKNLRGP